MLEEYIDDWEKEAWKAAEADLPNSFAVVETIYAMLQDLEERMEQDNPMTDGFTGEPIKPNMNKLRGSKGEFGC